MKSKMKLNLIGMVFICLVGLLLYSGIQSTIHRQTGSFDSACPAGMVKEGYNLSSTGQETIQCATKGWNAFHRFGFQGVMISLFAMMFVGFAGLILLSKPIMKRRVQAGLWKNVN